MGSSTDATARNGGGTAGRNQATTKSERRTFFERLCELRETYRATKHVGTRMTVDAALAYGNAALAEDVVIELLKTPTSTEHRHAA